jgi:hypothetical protein
MLDILFKEFRSYPHLLIVTIVKSLLFWRYTLEALRLFGVTNVKDRHLFCTGCIAGKGKCNSELSPFLSTDHFCCKTTVWRCPVE